VPAVLGSREGLLTTIGAESLVSRPSIGIWDPLLDRHAENQLHTCRKSSTVTPVITQDSDNVPGRKDDHHRDDREGQTSRPTVYPSA
jgi:hypothetical protein